MKKKRVYQIILISIVLIFTLSDASTALPTGSLEAAQASPLGPNVILGFLRTLEALNRRNQIYREAGITAKELNAYYDTLIENTINTRNELIKQAARGEDKSAFIRSYVRIEAALIGERKIAIQMVEAEKKGARSAFKKILKEEVLKALIASPGAQKLLKDIRETINGLRQAVHTIKDALSANLPTKTLINQFSERFGTDPITKSATHYLGSKIAQGLNQKVGGILTRFDKPSEMVQAEMDDALKKIDELDRDMANLQNQELTPLSLLEIGGNLSGFKSLDRSKAGVDAAATAYTNKITRLGLLEGTNMTQDQMRDRIRGVLLNARLKFLTEDAKYRTQFVSCISTSREGYLKAMQKLELTPEEPLDPEKASYLVCTYRFIKDETETDLFGFPEDKVAFAALIGPSKADAEAQTAGAATQPVLEENGQEVQADAASCDALEFISLELIEGPIEESKDDGSYSCYLNYSITNTHSSSSIVISWKHDISSSDRGPYWTHPKLGTGESYYAPLTLSSNLSAKGDWRTVDANYMMAWFATESCDRYKHQYWTTEEEPDKLLSSGFSWKEMANPCRR